MWLGVGAGLGVLIVAAVRALRGSNVPGWLPPVGVLLMYVAARRSFLALTPQTTPEAWAHHIAATGVVGMVAASAGAMLILVALLIAFAKRPHPGLLINGTLMAAAGFVWWRWSVGQAVLWNEAGNPYEIIEVTRAIAAERLDSVIPYTAGFVALIAIPAAVWSIRLRGWRVIGEGVASATLVAIVLGTGQPARNAVRHAAASLAMRCAFVPDAAQVRAAGPIPFDDRAFVRQTADGLEHYEATGWISGLPDSDMPVAVVMAQPGTDLTLPAWALAFSDARVAGLTPEPETPRTYDNHPVVRAARCGLYAAARPASPEPEVQP